jgi:high-affinity Fe2+/Pb2+ permease
MKSAAFIGVVAAVISGLLAYAGVTSATKIPSAGAMLGVLVAGVLGLVFYEWWYNSGLRMVLSAQQMLVAIDTEHNTREIVEALRRRG